MKISELNGKICVKCRSTISAGAESKSQIWLRGFKSREPGAKRTQLRNTGSGIKCMKKQRGQEYRKMLWNFSRQATGEIYNIMYNITVKNT